MARVGRLRIVAGERPLAQELHHLLLGLRVELLAGLPGRDEEVRRVERHLPVPRRVVAVGPHHEVLRADHRLHAANARRNVFLAVSRGPRSHGVQDAARRHEREYARGGLLQAAVRIVRQPLQRRSQLAKRRLGHGQDLARERALRP